jgi:hypothetical protein
MAKLKDEAMAYESKLTKNIADLDGEKYRVPNSVLKQLKVLLEDNPDLKKFKVKKSGVGLNTDYTVIPILKV